MNCPICSENNNRILRKLEFLAKDSESISLSITLCNKCNFVFYRHKLIDKLYKNNNSKYTKINSGSGADSKYDIDRLTESYNNISSIISVNSETRILDVGCNNGYLLSLFSNKTNNLFGIDISLSENLKIGSDKLAETKEIDHFKIKYDLVIVSHVLEHVDNIKLFLSNIFKVLKPCGQVYIEVPDAQEYIKYFISPFSYFDLEHINHFRTNDIIKLCDEFPEVEIRKFFYGTFSMSESHDYPYFAVNLAKKSTNKVVDYLNFSDSELPILNLNNDEFVAYGVGASTLRLIPQLNINLDQVKYFVDKNPVYYNSEIRGKKIRSLDYLIENSEDKILIFSKLYSKEIKRDLIDKGFRGIIIDVWEGFNL